MKYRKCEFSGCTHKGTHKGKNGHMLCDDHFRLMCHNHNVRKHNSFLKEFHIGSIGEYGVYASRFVKFF